VEVLERLAQRRVGQIILTQLIHPVFIRPLDFIGAQDAYVDGGGAGAGEPMDGWRAGERVVGRAGTHLGTGTGYGARDVVIRYTPGMWPRPRRQPHRQGLWLFDTDQVLLHEMVHAANKIAGSERQTMLGPPYFSVEEHRAVMVTNVYLSECRRMPRSSYMEKEVGDRSARAPRLGYRGVEMIANPLGALHPDVAFERAQIELYTRDYPTLVYNLAGLPETVCEYNPFRNFITGDYEVLPLPLEWCSPDCGRP
jgi:hypothetical protein